MSFAEAGVVIDIHGEPLYWHLPVNRSMGSLPDSRSLWDVLWNAEMDGVLAGFAHSHPGTGTPQPSHEDLTTFRAIEDGLGRELKWWITSANVLVLVGSCVDRQVIGNPRPIPTVYLHGVTPEPVWASELRRRSNT
jgi:hypothetical protein